MTAVRSTLKLSSASQSSRSIRSWVAPAVRCCSVASSASGNNPGICNDQVGARRDKIALAVAPSDDSQSRRKPWSKGRYGSPCPFCSTQCPCTTSVCDAGSSGRKASTSVVLPMPGSPVMKTICRSPAAARACAWASAPSSAFRPTDPAALTAGAKGGINEGPTRPEASRETSVSCVTAGRNR